MLNKLHFQAYKALESILVIWGKKVLKQSKMTQIEDCP